MLLSLRHLKKGKVQHQEVTALTAKTETIVKWLKTTNWRL